VTGDDWRRLGILLGVPFLVAHALAAFWGAKTVLMLPMEAGGLLLGPMIGVPLLGIGMAFLAAAVNLVVGREPYYVIAGAFVALVFDGFFLMTVMG